MSESPSARNLLKPLTPIPPYLVAQMRPELPSLFAEIVQEICATIPGYGELLDGPYGNLIKESVQRNLATFVARVANPEVASPERDELCRTAGRLEALNGHSMDRLQTAYRIGVQVAWRRAIRVARRNNTPMPVMSAFADTLFGYVNEMTALSREGHSHAKARSAQQLDERRTLLLRRLVEASPIIGGALAEFAERAAWEVPATATPVALSPGADVQRGALADDVLADLGDPRPFLLVPGEMDGDRERMLLEATARGRVATGLTVPLNQAAQSLRWARRMLALPRTPAGPSTAIVRAEDHLLELWLMADPDLARQIAERQLAPLDKLTPIRRARMVETLLAWLSSRGNVEQMAKTLGIHPQTVRYRMRGIDKDLGALMEDPEWRLTTEVVLRERLLAEQAGNSSSGGTGPAEFVRGGVDGDRDSSPE